MGAILSAIAVADASANSDAISSQLLAPFDEAAIQFQAVAISGNKAMAMPFLDEKSIRGRLNQVFGVAGWQEEYENLPDGSVVCRLRIHWKHERITRMDVGESSDFSSEARTNALRRVAVQLGIGRYLLRLPAQWVEFDAQKRQFVRRPTLPGVKPVVVTGNKRPRGENLAAKLRKYSRRRKVVA